jgi:hypothetical protein
MVSGPITLRQLLEQHPEWADLPLVALSPEGVYDWIGCSGLVYKGEDYSDPNLDVEDPANVSTDVLVFAPN